MTQQTNDFGQPIGEALDWQGAEPPGRAALQGRFCRLEALDAARHLEDLHTAFSDDHEGRMWTYMAMGPFDSIEAFRDWLEPASRSDEQLGYAIINQATGKAVGMASYLRIVPQQGVMEVGGIAFSPRLQKTVMATEAMYLMMQRAFNDLGYRRYEWKCDSLNEPSRRAAERLGFRYEGLFRQALVYKGRNRDTAWYAMLDRDWPAVQRGFQNWFDPQNFDQQGQQKQTLSRFIAAERELR